MPLSVPLRFADSVEHILSCALHEAELGPSDLSPTVKKDFEKRIKADLLRNKHQPIVPGKLIKSTLLKKYAALMVHELGARQQPGAHSSSMDHQQEQHKSSVEKILQRHSRERAAWDHVIQEDARSFAEVQERTRRMKEEQIRIQRETLDIQLNAQRREREERKAQEVADLHSMLRQQKEDEAREKQHLADQKRSQLSKRQEAERVSRDQIAARAREQEAARQEEKRMAMELAENERRRKEDEAAKRQDTQMQIQKFVHDNDALLRHKKRGGAALSGLSEQHGSGRISALPSGERPPMDPEKVKKAESLLSRKDRAAQAYLEQQQRKEEHLQHLEMCRQLRLENERRVEAETVAARDAAKLKSKAKYAKDLAMQVENRQHQTSSEAAADARFKSEIDVGVRYGALEERKMKEEQIESRHRNLNFLKAQLEAQRSLRSGMDVTPKIV